MKRAALIGLAAAVVAGPVHAAFAQTTPLGVQPPTRVVREITIPISVQGQVTVEFRGDHAAGCAATGLCRTSGLATWSPGRRGALVVNEYGRRGQRWLDGSLAFDERIVAEGTGRTGPLTVSQVERLVPGADRATCSDARVNAFFDVRAEAVSSSVLGIRLAGPSSNSAATDLIGTRCAGPLQADIAAFLPVVQLEHHALLAGRTALDMRTQRAFVRNGFAGSVRSSVILRLGTPAVLDSAALARLQRRFTRAFAPDRAVAIEYELERVGGEVLVDYASLSNPPHCAPFDGCNSSGTIRLAPSTSSGRAVLYATGPRTLHGDRLRAALGLAQGRVPASVLANGVAWWRDGAGMATQTHRNGTETCRDAAALAEGEIALSPTGRDVSVTYAPASSSFDHLQTRCPGPTLIGLDVPPMASASVPLRRFTHSRVRVRLTGGKKFSAIGYALQTRGSLTMVLRRKRVVDQGPAVEHLILRSRGKD